MDQDEVEACKKIRRKADIARAGLRISAAGGSAYLAQIFGPSAAATIAQTWSELGDLLVGALENWEQRRILRALERFKKEVDRKESDGLVVRAEVADPQSEGAAALFESIVEAAARSLEDKKCDAIANLYSSIVFDTDVSIDDALLYVRRIRAASWRQLVALRYFEDESRVQERELIGAEGKEGVARIHPALGIELSELAGRGLEFIGFGQQGGAVSDPASTFGGGVITSSSVARIRATGLGETMSRLARLNELVGTEEMDAIGRDLRSDERGS